MSYLLKRQSYHEEIRRQHQHTYIASKRKELIKYKQQQEFEQQFGPKSRAVDWLHAFIIQQSQSIGIQDLNQILINSTEKKNFIQEIIKLDLFATLVKNYKIKMASITSLLLDENRKKIQLIVGSSELPNLIVQELIKMNLQTAPQYYYTVFVKLEVFIKNITKNNARKLLTKICHENVYLQVNGFLQLIGLLLKFSYYPNNWEQSAKKYAKNLVPRIKYSYAGSMTFFYLVSFCNFDVQQFKQIIKILYQGSFDQQIIQLANVYFYQNNNLCYQEIRSYLIRPINIFLFSQSTKIELRNFCLKILTNALCNGVFNMSDIKYYFQDYKCQSLYRLCFDMHITKQFFYLLSIMLQVIYSQFNNSYHLEICMLKQAATVLIRSKRIQLKNKIKLIKILANFGQDVDQFQGWIQQYELMKRQQAILQYRNTISSEQQEYSESQAQQKPQAWTFQQ